MLPTCTARMLWMAALLACQAFAADGPAEPPFERGLDKLRLELMAARTGLRALSVAAHPDDEDGATISWLRRFAGVEVHMCLATRGEGGQNEAGPELGRALAWRRTQETEAAAAILGAKVWYLNLPDFGFSKSGEETFKHWNKEEALGRLVRIFRIVKPDLVFTNHNPEGKDHGHHVATAQLVWEAFEAAADAKRFPEQLEKEGLKPWKVGKLYRRLWDFEREKASVRLDVSQPDPSSGHSPAEIAAWALERHLTQGMKREVRPGEKVERFFELAKKAATEKYEPAAQDGELLAGYKGVPSVKELAGLVLEPGTVLTEANQTSIRAREIRRHVLGLEAEARPKVALLTPDEEAEVDIRLVNRGMRPVMLQSLRVATEPGWESAPPAAMQPLEIPAGKFFETTVRLKATTAAAFTYPPEAFLADRIESRSPAVVLFKIGGMDGDKAPAFELPPVSLPIHLAPPYTARFVHDPYLVFDDPDRDGKDPLECRARLLVTSYRREPWTLYVKPQENKRFLAQQSGKFAGTKLDFTSSGQTLTAELPFSVTSGELDKADLPVTALLFDKSSTFSESITTRFRRVPLKLPAPLAVGVVRTYDTATWDALKLLAGQHAGMALLEVTPEDLDEGDLSALHTLVLDIRATQYRPDVLRNAAKLKRYMEQGGNIVCLYHKDFDWNETKDDARGRGFFRGKGGGGAIAPFPITLSFSRITQADAPVRLLKQDHPLLSRPCKLWEADFAGWTQERGVYFPSKWDDKYTTLLSSHDPGEPALDGGLLVADLGDGNKGSFVYTSYVWYRQLRAGVPGAYRMLANLIAYPRVKK